MLNTSDSTYRLAPCLRRVNCIEASADKQDTRWSDMAAANRVKAVIGGESLAVAGARYNIPSPDVQDEKTCWYYAAQNMLRGWGLEDKRGGKAFKAIEPKDPKYEGKDRGQIYDDILKGAEFSFQKANLVSFGQVCDWLKDGPFMISLTKHPKASEATFWDSRVLGTPLGESADNILVRVPYELQGKVPHMMLVVGFVKRKYNQLRQRVQGASGIPDGVKKVISEITNAEKIGDEGVTNEVLLLDPNQPKMRPEFGKRNDVVICDWFVLSNGGNINYAFRVVSMTA